MNRYGRSQGTKLDPRCELCVLRQYRQKLPVKWILHICGISSTTVMHVRRKYMWLEGVYRGVKLRRISTKEK